MLLTDAGDMKLADDEEVEEEVEDPDAVTDAAPSNRAHDGVHSAEGTMHPLSGVSPTVVCSTRLGVETRMGSTGGGSIVEEGRRCCNRPGGARRLPIAGDSSDEGTTVITLLLLLLCATNDDDDGGGVEYIERMIA